MTARLLDTAPSMELDSGGIASGPVLCALAALKLTMDNFATAASPRSASSSESAMIEQLQNLVIDSKDVNEFLHELRNFAARAVSAAVKVPVVCAVTLNRRRRTTTAAWSDQQARVMDEIQHAFGSGPCLHAMNSGTTVLVDDTMEDARWPEYGQAIAGHGQLSVLAVPLALDEDARAALNIFAPAPDAFDSAAIESAQLFAGHAQSALRLAVRVATGQQLAADLRAAMESRTGIDLAAGIIMGQNRCSQEEAMAILVKASSARNQKLRTLAEQIVSSISVQGPVTHFD